MFSVCFFFKAPQWVVKAENIGIGSCDVQTIKNEKIYSTEVIHQFYISNRITIHLQVDLSLS